MDLRKAIGLITLIVGAIMILDLALDLKATEGLTKKYYGMTASAIFMIMMIPTVYFSGKSKKKSGDR